MAARDVEMGCNGLLSARDREVLVVQPASKCRDLPPEIRMNFVKKVYGILIAMLLISFGIVYPFVFNTRPTEEVMKRHPEILGICIVLLLAQQIVNIAMMLETCCGGGPCFRTYMKMFVTVPYNYIFLFTYAVCFGVLLGFVCVQYTASSVGLVFALTAAVMIALTVFAVFTKHDFTGFGMYICAMFTGLFLLSILGFFIPGDFFHTAIAVAGAVLFSFVIIYDTQLIFGTASLDLGNSAARKIEFTVDMYAFAAYQLYLDFVNMFLYLLRWFGERMPRDGQE